MGASSAWETNTPFRAFQTWKQSLKPKSAPECWLKTYLGGAVWPQDGATCQDAGSQVCTPWRVTSQQQPKSHEQICVLWFPLLEHKDNTIMSYLKGTEIAASSSYATLWLWMPQPHPENLLQDWLTLHVPEDKNSFATKLMLLFMVPTTQKLQGGQRDIDIMVLMPEVKEKEVCHGACMECTQVTLCTTGLYPIDLQTNSKTSLPGFKLYAGDSWLAWVRSSSYLNMGLCDRGKHSGLGWLLATL